MTGMSNYSADAVLDYLTGQVGVPALPAIYLAMFTAVGSDAGTGFTEVTGGSYARQQIAGALTAGASWTTSSSSITMASAVPAWVQAGMTIYDLTNGQPIGTVSSTAGSTVTLTGNATHASQGAADSLSFSTFANASGTAPSSVSNGSVISFPLASANWGTVVAWGLYDAASGGNLLWWDYMGAYPWLPCTVSAASPGVITAHAHGYSTGDSFVFSNEYGGTAPSFSAGNFNGILTVANAATDTFDVTGVNTSTTGDGMVRKVIQQSIPSGVTASFAASTFSLTLA